MTDNTQPEALAFCWATELAMTQQPVTLSVTEAREVSADMQRLQTENEALRVERERNLNSISVNNEIINKKNAELESLRTGYAAARLEIESLRARSVEPAGEYPALPDAAGVVVEHVPVGGGWVRHYQGDSYTADQMRAYVDADRAMRAAQPAPQQEAASVDLKTMELAESVGLIGPASRTHDLHAAIQRFHDLICVDATIKAAQMAAEVISAAAPKQEAQEPVVWQSRMRPTWGANTSPWSNWEPCTKGQAEDCWKTPLLHDWAYEARALVTATQPSPTPKADSVLEDAARLKEAVWLLEELAVHDNYSTEHDGRMLYICPECGEQDGEHRAACAFVRAKAFLAARKQGDA